MNPDQMLALLAIMADQRLLSAALYARIAELEAQVAELEAAQTGDSAKVE